MYNVLDTIVLAICWIVHVCVHLDKCSHSNGEHGVQIITGLSRLKNNVKSFIFVKGKVVIKR